MPLDMAALKRVPKWAWYTSAGVGIGAVTLYVVRNRDTSATDATGATGDGTTPTGYPDTFAPSPVPGIVVPDVNVGGDNAGENGYLDLHNMYLEAIREILDSYGPGAPAPAPAPVVPQRPPDHLPVILTGGGVSCTPRNGTSTVQCSPTTKPPKCTGQYNQLDHSGPHAGQCFRATAEQRSVKQGKQWFCIQQYKRHYKGGGTEWGGVIRKTKGKCGKVVKR